MSQVAVADDGRQGIWSVLLSLPALISRGTPFVLRSLLFIRHLCISCCRRPLTSCSSARGIFMANGIDFFGYPGATENREHSVDRFKSVAIHQLLFICGANLI